MPACQVPFSIKADAWRNSTGAGLFFPFSPLLRYGSWLLWFGE